ncbi:hypothetical protein [Janthinobacterium sp. UMAB-56]|uniref:hypothetical protein n=1 Tax=Janthinobacterium sp. UMAB-56 TaxID=1365361 RepID=UPI001C56DEB9|nr:hypothetical protein [Janthinobacterium sp. UMAB-56]
MLLHRHLQFASTRIRRGLSLKGAAVALILAMHALGLYFLLLPARQLKQYTEVAFMTLLPTRPPPQVPPMALPLPMPPPMPVPMPRARASAPPVAYETAPVTAQAITVPPEDLPAASVPAQSSTDLRTRARLAAGAADKALRGELQQDKPWLAVADLKSESAFQKLVASAWRGGPVIRVEEYLSADGRPVTRVVSAGGAACYGMDANPGAGADPFKTGGKVKRVPCPG